MKQTTYKDYLDKVYDEFPDVDKASVRMIVRHGLSRIGIFRLNCMDIFLYNNMEQLYYYFGEVMLKEDRFKLRKAIKLRTKIRLIYKLAKVPHDGYYYFGLTEEEYQKQKDKPIIDEVKVYRIYEECKIYRLRKHFFRVKLEEEGYYWQRTLTNYETTNTEYIS